MDRDSRRLLVFVAALVVVFFVGRAVLSSFFDDGTTRRTVASYRSKLSRGGEAARRPDAQDARALTAQRDALLEARDAWLPELQYVSAPEFEWQAGTSPDLHYLQVLRREQERLVQRARFVGKSVPPDLGMPVPNPTGLEDVLSALRALQIVNRVVTAALDADVAAVEAIRVRPRPRRPGSGGGFLRTHGVEFELRGSPQAVRRSLAGVVQGEPYLALDDVLVEALDEEGQAVRCGFLASALTLDPEQPVLED